MQEANWSVGKIAKRCGVKVSTLHFYEDKGLIKSWRNAGNQRRYKPDVMRRISVIKAAQRLGISLEEIKNAFAQLPENRTPDKQDWAKLSAQWHATLTEKIVYLTELRDSLTDCIGCGCLSLTSCPIYNKEDNLGSKGHGAVLLNQHVQTSIKNNEQS
ncbi:redox-sensitive transcriptional activator SoxR [Thalassotalea agarivorans]|uniref:Redox-sensitive transcriptional activator SoxR n=1 Tax=Thalassotalea agarivorans TaxID=349064 RepID=A0A1I0BJQ5_THASX|nr:redox-sensitive transcriptional activator SoxR [Thalassotalea agarivorans]SET07152.1 MerR family transcriptional regulator, redox-sensitive transcriptional activator SoxR [Thalassotalea agarivorans]